MADTSAHINQNKLIGIAVIMIGAMIVFNGFFLQNFYQQVVETAKDVAKIKSDVAVIKNNQERFQHDQDKLEHKLDEVRISRSNQVISNSVPPIEDLIYNLKPQLAILTSPFGDHRE